MLVENTATGYSLLRRHWQLIPAVLAIVAVVEMANDYVRLDRPAFSLAAVGLLISALSIFLAFRVNEAYTRWWEARILWGNLITASRAFARRVLTLMYVDPADEERSNMVALQRRLVYRQIAYVNALRVSLRDEGDGGELRSLLDDEEHASLERAVNRPAAILQRQGEAVAYAWRSGWMSDVGLTQLERALSELHRDQGACERIKNTPFPENVAHATRTIAWSMAVVVPVAITDQSNRVELLDMFVVPLLMLSFLLIERLGAELRNPFDKEPNGVPLMALCRSIERELRQSLGEETLPPPIEPSDGVLL